MHAYIHLFGRPKLRYTQPRVIFKYRTIHTYFRIDALYRTKFVLSVIFSLNMIFHVIYFIK